MQSYHCGALSLRSPPGAPSWDCFSRAPPPWCVPPVGVPCRRGVYRAAVGVPCRRGCTVPPWGLPSSRAGVERAPAQAAYSPFVGLDRCFRCLMGVARRGGKSTSAGRLFPLMGLDGARKVRPAHQLFSAPSSPTLLRAQLTNFSPRPAHQLHSGHSSPKVLKSQPSCIPPAHPQICSDSCPFVYLRTINIAPTSRRGISLT